MNLSDRDRRALIGLGVAVAIMALLWLLSGPRSGGSKIVQPVESVERAETRLATLREKAAALPADQENYKKVADELAVRERGLIQADTAAQAQARLITILREVAKNQKPSLDIRQTELGQPTSFGDSYGQVNVAITMDCTIEQLINFMAFLSAQPEIIATDEVRFAAANPKTKVIPVRMTISAIVPRKLAPEKKATALF